MTERKLPPVTEVGVAVLILVAVSVIYLAAHVPRPAPRVVPAVLLGAACLLYLWNVVALARIKEFAWDRFFQVFWWALLGYAIIAGMLEYVFVLDHTHGTQLGLMTLGLLLFMLDVPVILAFGVARYQPVTASPATGSVS